MNTKREAVFTFTFRNNGKKKSHKVELFKSKDWPEVPGYWRNTYRIRVNKKWYPENTIQFYYFGQIRSVIWTAIDIK